MAWRRKTVGHTCWPTLAWNSPRILNRMSGCEMVCVCVHEKESVYIHSHIGNFCLENSYPSCDSNPYIKDVTQPEAHPVSVDASSAFRQDRSGNRMSLHSRAKLISTVRVKPT